MIELILGLALSETEFRKPIFEHSRIIAHSVFVPLFFVDVGMNIPVKDLESAGLFALLFSLVAIASKVIVLMIFLSTLVTPPLLKLAFREEAAGGG